jgi:hypothetical protein
MVADARDQHKQPSYRPKAATEIHPYFVGGGCDSCNVAGVFWFDDFADETAGVLAVGMGELLAATGTGFFHAR